MGKKYVYLIIGLVLAVVIYLMLFKEKGLSSIDNQDIDNIVLSIYGNEVEYYFVGTYADSGAEAKLNEQDLSNLIEIDSNVNNNVPGEYEVIYRIGNDINYLEKKRKIIIEEINIDKTIDPSRNKIRLKINNNAYAYTILPDGIKETSNEFNYTYNDKGIYHFKIYLKSDSMHDYAVDVNKIDTTKPIGDCTSELLSNNSFNITVNAMSDTGILKYQYNGKDYKEANFNVESPNGVITIKVFDNDSNTSEITCKNVYGMGFKDTKPKSAKLGYAKCNSNVMEANIKLDKLIQSYGEKTRSAVAAAALFLTNYEYSIAYQWGGKYLKKGLNPEWGCSKLTMEHNGKLVCSTVTGADTCEAGLDCTGFTSWAFIQAGFDKSIIRTSSQSEDMWGNFNAGKHKYAFSSSNMALASQIKPGDLVWREGHVGIVIGVDDENLQITNELGPIIVQTNRKRDGASISGQAAFTHFVLFDDFYNMYGSNT